MEKPRERATDAFRLARIIARCDVFPFRFRYFPGGWHWTDGTGTKVMQDTVAAAVANELKTYFDDARVLDEHDQVVPVTTQLVADVQLALAALQLKRTR